MTAADGVGPLAGPKRIRLRPGRPFVHRLPVGPDAHDVGVEGLPSGLTIDLTGRVISGRTDVGGTHSVKVAGDGLAGPWFDTMELVVGDEICLTPPLGWNSWNVHGAAVSEDDVRAAALAIIESGLAACGWSTINIDDGWQGGRDRQGRLQPNDKFRDLSALCADLHDLGLRVGIYSSPGPTTCAGFPESEGFEAEDARSFAAWGFDYLKYDWCSAGHIDAATPVEILAAPYAHPRSASSSATVPRRRQRWSGATSVYGHGRSATYGRVGRSRCARVGRTTSRRTAPRYCASGDQGRASGSLGSRLPRIGGSPPGWLAQRAAFAITRRTPGWKYVGCVSWPGRK